MDFLENFNKDEVFFRGMIIGLLSSLNNKVTYYQANSAGTIEEIAIPFFASLAGDESFLQDFYLNYGDCDGKPLFAEGNYDVVPRGIIEYTGARINTASSTNKYVRATYEKELPNANGGAKTQAYSAYMVPIPLDTTFNLKIKVDTIVDALKIQARVIEVLFKNFVYFFEYAGFRIPVQVSLPDTLPDKQPNQFNYSYGTTRGEGITLTLVINAETYLPQIDPLTERFRGNLMQGGIRLKVEVGVVPEDRSNILHGIDVVLSDKTVLPNGSAQNNLQ